MISRNAVGKVSASDTYLYKRTMKPSEKR